MQKIHNEPNIKIKTDSVTIYSEVFCNLRQKEKSVILILSLFKRFFCIIFDFKKYHIILFILITKF